MTASLRSGSIAGLFSRCSGETSYTLDQELE